MNNKKFLDKFWYETPNILLRSDRLIEFFPTPDMNDSEKLNLSSIVFDISES